MGINISSACYKPPNGRQPHEVVLSFRTFECTYRKVNKASFRERAWCLLRHMDMHTPVTQHVLIGQLLVQQESASYDSRHVKATGESQMRLRTDRPTAACHDPKLGYPTIPWKFSSSNHPSRNLTCPSLHSRSTLVFMPWSLSLASISETSHMGRPSVPRAAARGMQHTHCPPSGSYAWPSVN